MKFASLILRIFHGINLDRSLSLLSLLSLLCSPSHLLYFASVLSTQHSVLPSAALIPAKNSGISHLISKAKVFNKRSTPPPAPRTPQPTTAIQHPASRIQHPVRNAQPVIRYPTFTTRAAAVSPAAQPAKSKYPPPPMTTSSIPSIIRRPAVGPWGWPNIREQP
jgi:hypothetical protein